MAQHPTKTTSGAPDRGLDQSDYVDLNGNLWVTGTISLGGVLSGLVLPVSVSGGSVSISGTPAFNISQVGGSPFALGRGASVSSLSVVLASDQAPLAVALPDIGRSTAPLSSTSTAYETNRVAKASPGVCFGIAGYNSKASTQFILVLDASALPADGAIPVDVISVAAASNFSIDFGYWGRRFNAGIVVCNSSTGPTKTIGSADCFFDVRFI